MTVPQDKPQLETAVRQVGRSQGSFQRSCGFVARF